MVRILLYFSLIFCFVLRINAQSPTPTVAAAQSEAIVILGGTVHTATGQIIENGFVQFENGVIQSIGDASNFNAGSFSGRKIDAVGKQIYPGLIAPNTILGLQEIGAVRATRDENETGSNNANVRAIIAYNTDSRVIPTIRSNGVLLAQIAPQGGLISGTSGIVQLDAWNWEDAAVRVDDGVFINWPNMYVNKGWWGEPGGIEKNKKYDEQVQELRAFLSETKAYLAQANPPKTNLKMEAFREAFDRKQNIYIRCNRATEMLAVIDFFKSLQLKPVLVGAQESWIIADLLVENQIPVILSTTHQLPATADEDVDQPFKTPMLLQDKGVLFCLYNGGFWEERNLMFMAGTAATYGLNKEQALQTITYNTAKILGIDKQYGSLEKGKSATILISEGDILDMKSSNVIHAFIDGREIDLNNKQKALYERYSEKYAK